MRGPGEQPGTRRYRIVHTTRYHYAGEVAQSFGRGVLRPRELPGQRVLSYDLHVRPEPQDRAETVDCYGNDSSYFQITQAHSELDVTAVAEVEVVRPAYDPPALGRPWEQARPSSHSDPAAMEFTLASPLVQLTSAVREYAQASFSQGRPIDEAVRELCSRINGDFRYVSGSTSVRSTVADVLRQRSGVCQDFAHLAVACLRSVGLAGRYVSGYLATDPPPGRDRVVGADAGHAWAAVRLADGDWLAFDPTNDTMADERYITVAWGRDYVDVPPLRGVIFTDAETSDLHVSVDVARI